jgi:predicted Zn-dependent protease
MTTSRFPYLPILLVAFLVSCAKVPISNRKQMNLLPESEMLSMSLTSYGDFLRKNPPVADTDPNAQLVSRVGKKISVSVEQYLKSNGFASRVKDFKWEFHLVNNSEVNAWCMPGGKVVVYSGLLPVTKDESSLACVMGHEIAHAVARHGNERMSQGLITELGGVALDVALANKSQQTRAMFMTAYGAGATVGYILPYSRLHESEADKLGVVFMAMAGYDPNLSIGFWERMSKVGGAKPPELLSTHPSDQTRIKDLKSFMPTAMKYYKPS